MSSWSGCVDTAGIADCGERHDAAREERAQDDADAAGGHWDRAIEAVEAGDIGTARQELEWARSLAAEWGDSSIETQALRLLDEDDEEEEDGDDDPEDEGVDADDCCVMVTVETMPDCHRSSHRAAGNWGTYPANGAERTEMTREDAQEIVDADEDGYDHIVEVKS